MNNQRDPYSPRQRKRLNKVLRRAKKQASTVRDANQRPPLTTVVRVDMDTREFDLLHVMADGTTQTEKGGRHE